MARPSTPAPELEQVGARLVAEVAALWSSRYIHMIRQHGLRNRAYHYECLFSCPTSKAPVPSVVISVRFALALAAAEARPRLLYSFEEGDLRHEWTLERDAEGQWHPSKGQQVVSLRDGSFEQYLDWYIREKETVRAGGVDLTTPFEASRLPLPPTLSQEDTEPCSSDEEGRETTASSLGEHEDNQLQVGGVPVNPEGITVGPDPEMAEAMQVALRAAGLACDKVAPPASVAELLAKVFDAADEENDGELPHYEMARLLGVTLPGFGLEEWDIHLLLETAQEAENGFIECKPFIQAAPEIIQALRKRRLSYLSRGLPGVEVPQEAVKHCLSDEITLTVEALMAAFDQCAQEDPSNALYYYYHQTVSTRKRVSNDARRPSISDGQHTEWSPKALSMEGEEQVLAGLQRRICRDCIRSLPSRLSPQEASRLMQMLPENDNGFVFIVDLVERLEALRAGALLNALVETDVASLRKHLVLRFRHLGLAEDGKLKVWLLKHALLSADQICLSRLQIHMLLSLAEHDNLGNVGVATFLGLCCVVIPHMCDAKIFVDTAERLQIEHAENMRRNETAELAALATATVDNLGQEGEEKAQEVEVDQETVERTLIQVFSMSDDTHRSPPSMSADLMFTILNSSDIQVQSCQLSEHELCGFVAEMHVDVHGEVAYIDHVKQWVPILFELRKNKLLGAYLKEGSFEALGIPTPDLAALEALFPLVPPESMVHRGRRPSMHNSSRRLERASTRDSFSHSRRQSIASVGPQDPLACSRRVTREETVESNMHMQPTLRKSLISTSEFRDHTEKSRGPPLGRGFQRRKDRIATLEKRTTEEVPVAAAPEPLQSPGGNAKARHHRGVHHESGPAR